jgi:hypothetical protein
MCLNGRAHLPAGCAGTLTTGMVFGLSLLNAEKGVSYMKTTTTEETQMKEKTLKALVEMYRDLSTEELKVCTWGKELHVEARNIVLQERGE